MTPVFCCHPDNDLFRAYSADALRCSDPVAAVRAADPGSAVLVLADGYPDTRTAVPPEVYAAAAAKNLRLFVEFPDHVPGREFGAPEKAGWERLVVNAGFGGSLPEGSILGAHACVYLPSTSDHSLLSIARVAGYDHAEFGIPDSARPALFERDGVLVATTKLSNFRTGRYAPVESWTAVWENVLQRLLPAPVTLSWRPVMRPSHGPHDPVGPEQEAQALERVRRWHLNADVLLTESGERTVRELLASGGEVVPRERIPREAGDGSFGLIEGYESAIQPDGTQLTRLPLRADSISETAMVLSGAHPQIASNLLDYIYRSSGMCGGDRGDPAHPAYGHIAWGIGSRAWEIANYGDDNARVILASLFVSAEAGTDRWLEPVLRAVLANLRTTGRQGFRGDRIDMPALTDNGWRHYRDRDRINIAPHFESYLWACYLWAYQVTGAKEYLDCASTGLHATMAAFPDGWRRNDVTEQARMLLPLAWLVRVADTAEHRGWLRTVATDLMRDQHDSGAIPERELGGPGMFQVPKTNEEYGINESPLIQHTGDPASDQLYTTGFAIAGLHEAAAAGEPGMQEYADRLTAYLVRIQTCSERPLLDGTWVRAFDFRRWDYWSSSADLGWGAWCMELGWGQAWIALTLALRGSGTSLWDKVTGVVPEREMADRLLREMLPD